MKKILVLAATAASLVIIAASPPASATCHCFCKVAVRSDASPGTSLPNTVIDYGSLKSYGNCTLQVAQKKAECSQLCTQAALNDSAQFNNDAWWCSRLPADFDGQVTAYSAIGTLSYDSAQGRHVHCITKCDCPPGWTWDANGPAGKRCKRAIDGCVLPGVPNNTQIDGWGFTWGEHVWQWGPCATQKWTEWFDRDDSTGNGDYEMLTDAQQAGKACANPLDIECKTLSGQNYTTTGLVYHCDKTKGGWCVNAEQSAGKSCLDFKVRYLCP